MKSFRLHIESRADLLQSALGLLIGAAIVIVLYYAPISSQLAHSLLLLTAVIAAGYLCRAYPARVLKHRYPNARALPLLTITFSLFTFMAVAQFILKSSTLLLALILPAGVCIAVFLFINRHDPDVMK